MLESDKGTSRAEQDTVIAKHKSLLVFQSLRWEMVIKINKVILSFRPDCIITISKHIIEDTGSKDYRCKAYDKIQVKVEISEKATILSPYIIWRQQRKMAPDRQNKKVDGTFQT